MYGVAVAVVFRLLFNFGRRQWDTKMRIERKSEPRRAEEGNFLSKRLEFLSPICQPHAYGLECYYILLLPALHDESQGEEQGVACIGRRRRN